MVNKIIQSYLILVLILIGAFGVRLYKFNNPVADWHAWRQADTSAVSRNFVKQGFDVFHPKFDDLSNVPSGKDNPEGFRFVEFPLFNVAQAGLFVLFDILTLEQWGRLVSIVASLLSLTFIYFLVRKYADATAAVFAGVFFAFIPFNIYYSRAILPDVSMVAAILGGIYFFDLWLEKNPKPKTQNHLFYILSIIFTSSAFLLKPYALFFTLPMLYLAYQKWGFRLFKQWQLWVFALVAITPLFLWRWWMLQYPEGIPVSNWLLNGGNIRFKGAYFYWIFADRIGRLILGYWGIALLVLGVLWSTSKKYHRSFHDSSALFFASFVLSSLLYLVTIARGNVQHDYYQILIVPTLVMYLGIGSSFLVNQGREYFSKTLSPLLFIICMIFTFLFGWYFIRDYYNINNPSLISAGRAIDQITPKDAKIIALYNGDTTFLYQTNRQGWASFEKPLEEMIAMGADYLAIVNPTEQDQGFTTQYKVVTTTPEYLLLDLHLKL